MNNFALNIIKEHSLSGKYFLVVYEEFCQKCRAEVFLKNHFEVEIKYLPIKNQIYFDDLINCICIFSFSNCIDVSLDVFWKYSSVKYHVLLDTDNPFFFNRDIPNRLTNNKLWEYIAINAKNRIEGGGWVNSYTREHFTLEEMDEYAKNAYYKLKPYLKKSSNAFEIGCSSGITMFKLCSYVGSYTAIDLSETSIQNNFRYIKEQGIKNCRLFTMNALDINKLTPRKFDLIIMNSVTQCFPNSNYLLYVIRNAIDLLTDDGIVFIGDVMDLDEKENLLDSLAQYSGSHPTTNTKTEFNSELFLSKSFFYNLYNIIFDIYEIEITKKIYSIENELTKFRYDVIIKIKRELEKKNKSGNVRKHFFALKINE